MFQYPSFSLWMRVKGPHHYNVTALGPNSKSLELIPVSNQPKRVTSRLHCTYLRTFMFDDCDNFLSPKECDIHNFLYQFSTIAQERDWYHVCNHNR